MVVEVFDGLDLLLAVALQRGPPDVPFKGAASIRMVWFEGAAAGADGFFCEAGGVQFKTLKVRPEASVAGPVRDEFVQGAPGEAKLCGLIVKLL